MTRGEPATDADLARLQHDSFKYFLKEANPANGLVIDKPEPNWPASIAATDLALAAYPVGVERGFMSHAAAVQRTLRFFWSSAHGPEPDGTGYNGFYYHFLDIQSGRRAWQCELSTVDSTFLLAGDRAHDHRHRRPRAGVLRVRGAGRTVRTRRRHHRTMGHGRVAALRPRDRAAGTLLLYARDQADRIEPVRIQVVIQRDYRGEGGDARGWTSPWHFGLNQGPIVLMIENHRTGLLWELTRQCPYLAEGLRRAGFAGGWL